MTGPKEKKRHSQAVRVLRSVGYQFLGAAETLSNYEDAPDTVPTMFWQLIEGLEAVVEDVRVASQVKEEAAVE